MNKRLNELKIGQAAEWIYSWFWHAFCDHYIEMAKQGLISKSLLDDALKTNLILMHPFMPFVTEAVWQELKLSDKLLIEESWPTA